MRQPSRAETRRSCASIVSMAGFVTLMACSSDSIVQPDAGEDADADGDSHIELEITPPAPPVLTPCPEGWLEVPPEEEGGVATCDPWPDSSPVDMTECPEGWRSVEDDGVASCDPWPEDGPAECAADEAHLPGEPGCVRIGTACPEGDWADDLPTDVPVLYVLAGAPAGGEGTRASPFGSIGEAIRAASTGTVLALSKGTFDEEVLLGRELTLWGACVAETVLTCSVESASRGVVIVNGRDVVVRNLRISGPRPGIWAGGEGLSIHMEDVAITETVYVGLAVFGGTSASVRSFVIADTRCRSEGDIGRGMIVQAGGQIDASRGVIERNGDAAVTVEGGGSEVVLEDVVVRDTLGRDVEGGFGMGLSVSAGANVIVSRSAFSGNRDRAIIVSQSGSNVELCDVVVTDTLSNYVGDRGFGLEVATGASATIHRTSFWSSRKAGILVSGLGSEAALTDVVVANTLPRESGEGVIHALSVEYGASVEVERSVFLRNQYCAVSILGDGATMRADAIAILATRSRETDGVQGIGFSVSSGARAEVTRALIERSRASGIAVSEEGAFLVLSDAVVRDGMGRELDGQNGYGISAVDGGRFEVSRALIARNRQLGAFVAGPGASMSLTDVVISDIEPEESSRTAGHGLFVVRGAQIDVTRAVFERNAEATIVIGEPDTTATMTDLLIRDTQSREIDGDLGRGLEVILGARAELRRAIVERNRECNITARDPDTMLTLEDVLVRGAMPADCSADGDCAGFGDGIIAAVGASIDGSRFVSTRNARCGVAVFQSSMDLREGVVAENVIGACVQADEFELDRLLNDVLFRDNERRLDPNFDMPAPESVELLE